MSFIAVAIAGSGLLGAGASIYGASTQAGAARNATNAQLSMFNRMQANEQPFISAGQSVLPTLESLLTPGPNQTATLSQLPGFQFAQDWGQKGVTAQGTTRGLGGNVLTAGANYATGLAQQGFSGLVENLQNFANMGANTAVGAGNQGVQVGGQIGSNIIGAGNAMAAGGIGAANSIGGAAQTYALLQAMGLSNGQYGSLADAGYGNGVGSGGYNFLDAQAGNW